jgi:hypothetical protein
LAVPIESTTPTAKNEKIAMKARFAEFRDMGTPPSGRVRAGQFRVAPSEF